MGAYQGLYELVLEVQDIEEAEAFYRDVLAMTVLQRTAYPGDDDVIRRVTLDAGNGVVIGLWLPQEGLAGGRGGAHVHYALTVAPEHLMQTRQRLGEYGVPITHDAGAAIYFDDPDGNVVELGAAGSDWVRPPLPQSSQ